MQDARVAGKTVGPTDAPFRGPFDLRMAFADVGSATAPVAARLGRQELAFGEQRLVGHLSWVNTGRTFDAARGILRHKAFQVDVFAASVVRILPDEFDKSGNGNRFAGAYATTAKLVPKGTVEPYVFFRRDVNLRSELGAARHAAARRRSARASSAGCRPASTTASRWRCSAARSPTTRSAPGPATGSCASRCPAQGAVKLTSRIQLRDRRRERDRRHARAPSISSIRPATTSYGLADQVGWRNVHHLREGFEFSPIKAHADLGELPLVVAGREDRRPLRGERRRASPSCPAARPAATSARRSTSR